MSNYFGVAKIVSRIAHQSCGQIRKYTGEPYYRHPERVSYLVSGWGGSDDAIMAAYLHDVLEDTKVPATDLLEWFPDTVVILVDELTNVYTKDKYPDLNREQRFQKELLRLVTISPEAKLIKCCDILDNISDIALHDSEFAKVYLREKHQVLESMIGCSNPELRHFALKCVKTEMSKLNLI
jgi:(p)ppGpp synthase/HD superfamily hydrolase